jgi:hypothetical protein
MGVPQPVKAQVGATQQDLRDQRQHAARNSQSTLSRKAGRRDRKAPEESSPKPAVPNGMVSPLSSVASSPK